MSQTLGLMLVQVVQSFQKLFIINFFNGKKNKNNWSTEKTVQLCLIVFDKFNTRVLWLQNYSCIILPTYQWQKGTVKKYQSKIIVTIKTNVPGRHKFSSHFISELCSESAPGSLSRVTLRDEETSIAICQCEHYAYELTASLWFSQQLVHVHLTFDIEGMPSCCSLWDCDSTCPNLNWWRWGSSAKSSLYLSAWTIYVH